ncbi:hypothetical protein FDP41_010504 [Naegleria fowleri]|uniref:Uncharacterized protein n=1 Tax=Naegleria fowleri TaxID=5763 RepID=A0A6A5CDR0_NAEFO|nr:uncharacterized protein FDP41_010504 [Naegleria fowleri]KAF0983439.1 hypothetical protein FDP41_010504 [Naegleria fowleri]
MKQSETMMHVQHQSEQTFVEFLSCLYKATQRQSSMKATTIQLSKSFLLHQIQNSHVFKQLFRSNSSSVSQHSSLRLIYDLYHLSVGLRQCVLLDYVMIAKEEKLCQLLFDFSKEWTRATRLKLMKIEFVTLLGGNWEEMIFTYLINENQLRNRAKQIINAQESSARLTIRDRLFVNIDILEAEPRSIPCLLEESSHRLNDIDAFAKQLFKEIDLRMMAENCEDLQVPIINLKFLKESFENGTLSYIPFDATLMNALLLNYPIILFYGSRFNTSSDSNKMNFVANHCLNNLNLQRYSLFSSLLVDGPFILQFVIPSELYEEHRSVFDSCIVAWLENVKSSVNSTSEERNGLYLKIESLNHDNIVL